MPDYSKGKIYKLVCNKTGLTYYGSTTETLSIRKAKHKCSFKTKKHCCSSSEIIKNEDFYIVLLEDYPCERKEQLEARERWYIENNECVNKKIPTRSYKEYYEENKEEINKRNCEYAKKNRTFCNEISIKSYYKNKEKINEKAKETMKCECGSIFRKVDKSKHYKTKKHLEHLGEK